MIYYHGRSSSRPFYGKYIYITPSQEYAKLYSNDGFIFECTLLCDEKDLFSILNKEHQKLFINEFGSELFSKTYENKELDWAKVSNVSNNNFELFEDFLKHLNFKGLILQERSEYISLYVFDQSNVKLGNKIS